MDSSSNPMNVLRYNTNFYWCLLVATITFTVISFLFLHFYIRPSIVGPRGVWGPMGRMGPPGLKVTDFRTIGDSRYYYAATLKTVLNEDTGEVEVQVQPYSRQLCFPDKPQVPVTVVTKTNTLEPTNGETIEFYTTASKVTERRIDFEFSAHNGTTREMWLSFVNATPCETDGSHLAVTDKQTIVNIPMDSVGTIKASIMNKNGVPVPSTYVVNVMFFVA